MKIFCFLLFFLPTLALAEAPRIFILSRHAEKAGSEDQSPLTKEGYARAAELARALGSAEITSIYSSTTRRTRETAEPVARNKGLDINLVSPGQLPQLLKKLESRPEGSVTFVVWHMSMLPQIVQHFGATTPEYGEDEYDRLLILSTEKGSTKSSLLTLRYGPPSIAAKE